MPVSQPADHHLARARVMTPDEPFVPSGPPAPSMPLPRIPPALASLILFPGPASGASRPAAQSPALHLRSNPPLDETQMIEMRAMLTRAGLDATRWRPLEGPFYFLPPTDPVPAVEAVAPAVLPPIPRLPARRTVRVPSIARSATSRPAFAQRRPRHCGTGRQ